ncbi:MAG: CDGSH iron-sulfur domain-containing protein [Thermoproteota archaeon]|nr:CDGSH iron-sulfur domain-containing protein [Thermoproteota archaeon]
MEAHSGIKDNQLEERPKIVVLPNGPYLLINDNEPKIIENLQNSKGEPLSTLRGVSLCRCGASNNKPFCDGTHGRLDFQVKIKVLVSRQSKIREKIM